MDCWIKPPVPSISREAPVQIQIEPCDRLEDNKKIFFFDPFVCVINTYVDAKKEATTSTSSSISSSTATPTGTASTTTYYMSYNNEP